MQKSHHFNDLLSQLVTGTLDPDITHITFFSVYCELLCFFFRGFSHQQLSDEAAVHFSWFASSSAAGSVETCPRQEETEGMAAGFDWQSELCDYGLHTPQ